jgi:peptide/nickel transport system permease protein
MATENTNKNQEQLNNIITQLREFISPLWANTIRKTAVAVLSAFIAIGIFGPYLNPRQPYNEVETDEGFQILQEPSMAYPFGTTSGAYDVFSQTLLSFRTSLQIGILAAFVLIFIGLNAGLIAGYYGGWVETIIMGTVDLAYGMPFLPFAIVFVAVFGQGFLVFIAVIGLLLWRGIARVVRSETLSLREREFVKGAKASGASDIKIMYLHILPNLIPIVVVYFVIGAIYGILIEASLSFVGLGDPSTISWGMMLYDAFNSGSFMSAWWWVLPPALCLWLFIWSLYTVGRALEDNIGQGQTGIR